MRRFSIVVAILALHAIAGADALRTQIDAMHKAVHTAIMNKDIDGFVKAVKSGVTKDFKCYDKGKVITFDQMVSDLKWIFTTIPTVTGEDSILLSLVTKGDTATGTTEHKIKGISTDDNGDTHKLAFYGTSVDTYIKVDGEWRMSSINWRTRQMTLDGQPLEMPKSTPGSG